MITKEKKVNKQTELFEKFNWNNKLFKNYPEDWNRVKLGDILIKIKNPVDVKNDEYYEEIGIRSHGKGIFHKEKVLGEKLGDKSVFWIEPDCFVLNIVFAWEQAIAITTENEKGKIASHRFPMWKPQSNLDLQYLLYFFRSPVGKHLLAQASPGGAGRNKTLGQDLFNETMVCIPKNIYEQKKIVKILSTWDKAISLKEELINQKKIQLKVLMKSLLTGKKRLDGFSKKWDIVNFKDITNILSCGIASTPEYVKDGVPFLSAQNISSDGNINLNKYKFISNELHEKLTKNKKVVRGDILYSRVGSYGNACIVDFDLEFSIYVSLTHIRIKKEYFNKFYCHLLNSEYCKKQAESGIYKGGGVGNLNVKVVEKYKMLVPTYEEQIKISKIIDCSMKNIKILEEEVKFLKEQKKGLMQLLLTGKIRVNTGE